MKAKTLNALFIAAFIYTDDGAQLVTIERDGLTDSAPISNALSGLH